MKNISEIPYTDYSKIELISQILAGDIASNSSSLPVLEVLGFIKKQNYGVRLYDVTDPTYRWDEKFLILQDISLLRKVRSLGNEGPLGSDSQSKKTSLSFINFLSKQWKSIQRKRQIKTVKKVEAQSVFGSFDSLVLFQNEGDGPEKEKLVSKIIRFRPNPLMNYFSTLLLLGLVDPNSFEAKQTNSWYKSFLLRQDMSFLHNVGVLCLKFNLSPVFETKKT